MNELVVIQPEELSGQLRNSAHKLSSRLWNNIILMFNN